MTSLVTVVLLSLALMPGGTGAQAPTAPQAPSALAEELWAAARAGEAARVTAALDKGADVNAKTRYGATALTFAADKGHVELVKLLIARGADINVQDTFYKMRAIDMAMMNNHPAVVTLLLQRGSQGAPGVLRQAIQRGNAALVAAALDSPEVTQSARSAPRWRAQRRPITRRSSRCSRRSWRRCRPSRPPEVAVDRATLQSYVGSYRNEDAGAAITVALRATS